MLGTVVLQGGIGALGSAKLPSFAPPPAAAAAGGAAAAAASSMDWGKLEDLANAVAELSTAPSDSIAGAGQASRKRARPSDAQGEPGAAAGAAALQHMAAGEIFAPMCCLVHLLGQQTASCVPKQQLASLPTC
jgi:hypothetical protein